MQLNNNTNNNERGIRVTDKELTLMYEIGLDLIPTATEFVVSISMKYSVSQSGVWYTLKKLKIEGLVEFAEKGEQHIPLALTESGTRAIRSRIVDVQNRRYHYITGIANPIQSRA